MTSSLHRHRRSRGFLLLLAVGAACLAGGCDQPAEEKRLPNVVLITISALRPDRLACDGDENCHAPEIVRFAETGVHFANAYTDIPSTTPAVASTMTGLYGPHHGLRKTGLRLPEDVTTLAEILRFNGYRTAAVSGSFLTDSMFNLDQGFAVYDDNLDSPVVEDDDSMHRRTEPASFDPVKYVRPVGWRDDEQVTDAALRQLNRLGKGPFLLWAHYFGAHQRQFDAEGTPFHAAVVRKYDDRVEAADASVGRLLKQLQLRGIADDTIVVLHADHGQALREHDLFGHGYDLYEPSVRIPLILRFPGIVRPKVVHDIVRNVDILPTVLDLVGVPVPPDLDGRSLKPMLTAEDAAAEEAEAYFELLDAPPAPVAMVPAGTFFAASTWYGIRTPAWKYMNVRLSAPCVRNPTAYRLLYFFEVNPTTPVNGESLDARRCEDPLRQDLYKANDSGEVADDITRNVVTRQPDVARRLRERIEDIRRPARPAPPALLDPDHLHRLRSILH